MGDLNVVEKAIYWKNFEIEINEKRGVMISMQI